MRIELGKPRMKEAFDRRFWHKRRLILRRIETIDGKYYLIVMRVVWQRFSQNKNKWLYSFYCPHGKACGCGHTVRVGKRFQLDQ